MMRKYSIAAVLAVSALGISLVATSESGSVDNPKLDAYADPIGIPTICDGHTQGVTLGMRATPQQCQIWLKEDLGAAGKIIGHWVTTPITQEQYDALTSFVYNVGSGKPGVKDGFVWLKNRDKQGRPRHSTMLNMINSGDCLGAAGQFRYWNKAGDKPLRGLTIRRADEAKLFATGCQP